MAGLTHLMDSNVVIDVLRGPGPDLSARLLEHDGRVAVSAITVAEVTYGALHSKAVDRQLDAVEEFLDFVPVLEVDQRVGRIAGAIRQELAAQGKPIGPYDVLIAAQARAEGLVLVTGNTDEFGRVSGIQIENWRSPDR